MNYSTSNTELQLFQQAGLFKSGDYNYSEIANSFLSGGYTSAMGNTYFNSVWFVDGLAILANIGQGYAYTFLNGLKIINLADKEVVSYECYNCHYYSKDTVIADTVRQLAHSIIESAQKKGIRVNCNDVVQKVQSKIIDGFNSDQRYMLQANSQKFIKA
ncbi:MAG: hypothetical protein ACK5LR_11480 [Mangrovibacterium sp.]